MALLACDRATVAHPKSPRAYFGQRPLQASFGLAGTTVGLAETTPCEGNAHLLLAILEQLGRVTGQDTCASRPKGLDRPADTRRCVRRHSHPTRRVLPWTRRSFPRRRTPSRAAHRRGSEALAAETAADLWNGTDDAGLAHEPRGASRDEEHGEAALQRAEGDEITAEATAALEATTRAA